MTRVQRALVILVVASFGLWGCAQNNGPQVAAKEERIKSLEAKCARLENEVRSIKSDREYVNKKVLDLEKEKVDLIQEVDLGKLVARERDELKSQLASRTTERDTYQTQFEGLRTGIKSLLGQAEAVIPTPPGAEPAVQSAEKPNL